MARLTTRVERSDQLDSLRFIAILFVLFDHFAAPSLFSPGTISVRFFLMLSGFLITQTLHRYLSFGAHHRRRVLASFYGRRALRIWPLHYAILAALLVGGALSIKQFAFHGTFITNIVQAWKDTWHVPWFSAHLWTISVQEQFYLVWPLLFCALQRRSRQVLLTILIAAAMAFRAGMEVAGFGDAVGFYTLPFASFDALAGGSLLALFQHRLSTPLPYARPITFALIAACLGMGLLDHSLFSVILPTLWLVPLGVLTICAYQRRLGSLGAILEHPALVFLGRISLGIYLLHLPVWYAFMTFSPKPLSLVVGSTSWTTFFLMTTATLACAALSWLLFEKPLQQFRKYMPYVAEPRPTGEGLGRPRPVGGLS